MIVYNWKKYKDHLLNNNKMKHLIIQFKKFINSLKNGNLEINV